ncbi:MAG: AAA family ATPase [Bacteroidota bacterium]|nr:AAA family ATPase [Bacteroidota bacterium]MXW14598.1 AAA family ATPase [Rhodothermaceae bacterium]MDE2644636.1 AAA family ATPase [Bacteroidota bacterium]MXW33057.1 AAA family ATPase [Rhodothermaceae bacterium]MYC04505.1 AAA family ATPase [Rhodothermaceae bacterium]
MNIDRIRVKGLFDAFNYDLKFVTNERIMIVTGPNGSGKTTILKLLDVVFNQSVSQLSRIPFREVGVFFDDKTQLVVQSLPDGHDDDQEQLPVTLTYHQDGEVKAFHPHRASIDPANLGIPISAIEDIIPVLDRIGGRQWVNLDTLVEMDLYDVITTYPDYFPSQVLRDVMPIPEWFQDIKQSVNVRFIDTERLTHISHRRQRYHHAASLTRAVSLYSQQLAEQIRQSVAEYGEKSQSLDRTFPRRLVTDRELSRDSVEELRRELNKIEQRRLQLEEAGLLVGEHGELAVPDLSKVDKSKQNVLAVYAKDAREKLEIFDDLYGKVNAFKKIVNSRFSHKQVSVSDRGFRVSKNGDNLDLELLSSGEQHELVMLYELLFHASSNSLILIDEPELSLHVAWQEQWLDDLAETVKLSNFRAIVATHSPEIIDDNWHLVVELVS